MFLIQYKQAAVITAAHPLSIFRAFICNVYTRRSRLTVLNSLISLLACTSTKASFTETEREKETHKLRNNKIHGLKRERERERQRLQPDKTL